MTPLLLGLFGFGLLRAANAEVHRFERLAGDEIASLLSGDRKQVRIRSSAGPEAMFGDVHAVTIEASRFTTDGLPLFTEPWRSRRGLLRNLRIDLRDFSLRGLRIDRLHADIPDCRFDLALAVRHHRFRLSRSGTGSGEVAVAAPALAEFILGKFHEIKKAEVRIERDKLFIEGHAELLLLTTDFSIVAKLEPMGGSKLNLAYAKVLFDGSPADPALEKVLLDTLNPVIDLDRDLGLSGAMSVERLRLRDNMLTAQGATKIPAKVQGTNLAVEAL